MAITKEEVKYIAHLARLGLTDAEVAHFQTQLEVILEYIDKLKKLDVSHVESMAHILDLKNVYRPDEVRPSMDAQKILKIAPACQGHFFKVPKIIE